MLVLTRKIDQAIVFEDDNTIVRVLKIVGNRVTLGIDAPTNVKVLREELRPRTDGDDSNDTGR